MMEVELEAKLARARKDQAPASRAFVVAWAEGIIKNVAKAIRADRDAHKTLARRLESTDQLLEDLERRLAALESKK